MTNLKTRELFAMLFAVVGNLILLYMFGVGAVLAFTQPNTVDGHVPYVLLTFAAITLASIYLMRCYFYSDVTKSAKEIARDAYYDASDRNRADRWHHDFDDRVDAEFEKWWSESHA